MHLGSITSMHKHILPCILSYTMPMYCHVYYPIYYPYITLYIILYITHILELSVKYWYLVYFFILWSLLMLLLSSTLLCTHPTSTTLFLILSKQSVLVLSFEYLMDNSIAFHIVLSIAYILSIDCPM
jgi:hypothetical protein